MSSKIKITKRSEDYSRWYTDVIAAATLADYSPVKGCMVIRPYGYAIWENIQKYLDKMFKEVGVENAYFPLFIPESFLKKEKEHVEGFSPECAVVTHGGGKQLEEPLIVRPTSETIINSMFSKWITSWRDLPLIVNQWCNIVRWEMRTRLFLRTTEFLWQEGHTAHATEQEAEEQTLKMLDIYQKFVEEYMSIHVIKGLKTEQEKFAGALRTYSIEAMMQDKKALQAGTSHNLGQNFAKAFDIKYQSKEEKLEYVWQTSWGVSTRLIGALIMAHSDDDGLVLPPKIAPIKVVIIPIWKSGDEKDKVITYSYEIKDKLKEKFSVKIDSREEYKPGWKFYEWEQKGVPLRIEIGPKDIENNQVTIVRRDTKSKQSYIKDNIVDIVNDLLNSIQLDLFNRSKDFLYKNIYNIDSFSDFEELMSKEGGFVKSHWCGLSECELEIKERTKATIRCIPLNNLKEDGKCILCGKPSKERVVFAKAY